MNTVLRAAATALLAFMISTGVCGQAPANDACAAATALTPGVSVSIITAGATPDGPTCGNLNAGANDVWYSFTSAADQVATFAPVNNFFNYDAGVFEGACGALTPVLCMGNLNNTSPLVWHAVPGTTYFLRIVGSTNSFVQTATLTLSATPANDECSGAITVTDGVNPAPPFGVSGTTFDNFGSSTNQLPASPCVVGFVLARFDVWFVYAATSTGTAVVHTCTPPGLAAGTFTDSQVDVYVGGCGALTSISCDTSMCAAPTNNGAAVFLATSGVSYFIRVSSNQSTPATATAQGTFYLTVQGPLPVPSNDECTGATPLSLGSNTGSLIGATPSAETYGCPPFPANAAFGDVWHSFTTSVEGLASFQAPVGGVIQYEVLHGACGGPFSLATCHANNAINPFYMAANETVLIRVTPVALLPTYTLIVSFSTPPANDECVTATPAILGPNTGTVYASTLSAGPAIPCAIPAGRGDVWHTFTAASAGTLSAEVNLGFGVSIVAGACGAGTTLSCQFANDYLSLVTTSAVVAAGQTVYVRVFGAQTGSSPTYTLTLSVTATLSNDDPSGAAPLPLGTVTAAIAGATPSDSGVLMCNGSYSPWADVWYAFTAPSDGLLSMSQFPFNTSTLSVYMGTAPTGIPVACVGPGAFIASVPITANSIAFIRVVSGQGGPGSGGAVGATAPVVFQTNFSQAITNDSCTTPIALQNGVNPAPPFGITNFTYSLIGTTPSSVTTAAATTPFSAMPAPCGGYGFHDVFFSYVATCSGGVSFFACPAVGGVTNLEISIFDPSACPSGGASLACGKTGANYAACAVAQVAAQAGQSFLIRVSTVDGGGVDRFTVFVFPSASLNDAAAPGCSTPPASGGPAPLVPKIAGSPPVPGQIFVLQGVDFAPGAIGFIFGSAPPVGPTSLGPLFPGCMTDLDIGTAVSLFQFTATAAGGFLTTALLPPDPQFIGICAVLHLQGVALPMTPGAVPQFSNGLKLHLGL